MEQENENILEKKIFSDKKISDLMSEIYNNQQDNKEQIHSLINDVSSKCVNVNDATMITPMIQTYLDLSLRNDRVLIDLLNSTQKLIQSQSKAKAVLDNLNMDNLEMEDIKREIEQEQQTLMKKVI